MHGELAVTANLLGEPARAAILLKLMSGRALAAGELALFAKVSPQTASGHLAKLVEESFVHMERQGRHPYYCLAGTEVADAVEALPTLTAGTGRSAMRNAAARWLEQWLMLAPVTLTSRVGMVCNLQTRFRPKDLFCLPAATLCDYRQRPILVRER